MVEETERHRETERDTERHRETERQGDRETGRQRERERGIAAVRCKQCFLTTSRGREVVSIYAPWLHPGVVRL